MGCKGVSVFEVHEELLTILDAMDVPFYKKSLNLRNLTWLHKNLAKRNSEHPKFNRAASLIEDCLKNKWYTN